MKANLYIASLLLVVASPVFSGQWSDWGTVTEVQTFGGPNGAFRFRTSAVHKDDGPPCGSDWYFVSEFTGYQKEQISMLLAAFAENKEIRVNVSGCGGWQNQDTTANYFHVRN